MRHSLDGGYYQDNSQPDSRGVSDGPRHAEGTGAQS